MTARIASLTLIVALATAGAFAQAKVGYVDIDRVTEKAKAVNEGMNKVKDKVQGVQKQIDEKKDKLRALTEDIKKTEGVLSRDEMDKKRKEGNRLRNEINDLDYQTRREMQRLDDEFFTPMLKKIVYAIQDVAKDRDLDLVVRGEAVLYGRDTVDITEDVIKKLNVRGAELSGASSGSGDDADSTASRTVKKLVGSKSESAKEPTDAPAEPTTEEPAPKAATPTKAESPAAKPEAPVAKAPLRQEMPAAPTSGGTRPAGTRPVDRQPE